MALGPDTSLSYPYAMATAEQIQPPLRIAPDRAPFARRIEEASLNAWPAMQQTLLDGWVLRFSKGFTKRSNSIVPLYPGVAQTTGHDDTTALLEKIRYCENLYAREQLQTVFRLTSIAADGDEDAAQYSLDAVLAERGYRLADTSLVLCRALPTPTSDPLASGAEFKMLPLADWLDAYCRLTGMDDPVRGLHNIILKSIAGDCGFAVLESNGQPIACGLAVVEGELIGLFDIYTEQASRNLGLGKRIVAGLLDWAYERGARWAYLQMVADNAPAAALYEQLGFEELYRYWYRIAS